MPFHPSDSYIITSPTKDPIQSPPPPSTNLNNLCDSQYHELMILIVVDLLGTLPAPFILILIGHTVIFPSGISSAESTASSVIINVNKFRLRV